MEQMTPEMVKELAQFAETAGPLLKAFILLNLVFIGYLVFIKIMEIKQKSVDSVENANMATAIRDLKTEYLSDTISSRKTFIDQLNLMDQKQEARTNKTVDVLDKLKDGLTAVATAVQSQNKEVADHERRIVTLENK